MSAKCDGDAQFERRVLEHNGELGSVTSSVPEIDGYTYGWVDTRGRFN